ncbi:MAG: hypothetical protein KDD64_06665 [Bdellovibrionales bacterium]|nr:hypothetical protein [Bdellovibrionales bacterium]
MIDHHRRCGAPPQESSAALPQIDRFQYSQEELSLVVPKQYGGLGATKVEALEAQFTLARENLSRAFVLSQRNAAIGWIVRSKESPLRNDLLERATTEYLATQAVSVIAPSSRASDPLVKASETDRGFLLDGTYPWVTGLSHAQFLVGGATLSDGSHALLLVNTDEQNAERTHYAKLHALEDSDSWRFEVRQAFISSDRVLIGPRRDLVTTTEEGRTVAYPPLATSALALGHASKLVELLQRAERSNPREDEHPSDLLNIQIERLKTTMRNLVQDPSQRAVEDLRARSNLLVMSLSQLLLLETRGRGFVSGSPIEKAIRESHFFQVWANSEAVEGAVKQALLSLVVQNLNDLPGQAKAAP